MSDEGAATAKRGRTSRLLRWLHRRRSPDWGTRPDQFDPRAVDRVLSTVSYLFDPNRPFAVTVRGWEHVGSPPALLVSNHSGGSTTLDAWGFGYAWYRHFGPTRPVHVMAHEILLATHATGPLMSRIGALKASRGRAREVLERWHRDLWVMPGGDSDSWRPWRDRYRTQFGGHLGYARLALSTGTRVTPVAHAGAHETLFVVTDGRELARRLRLHELFRVDVFPIHLSLPWGLGIGPLPHLPLPRPLRYQIGPPVAFPAGFHPGDAADEGIVRAYDCSVRAGVQRLLDALAE